MSKTDWLSYKPVGTWISKEDFESLQMLAHRNNVTASSYIRGIIVDAIQEETSISTINMTLQAEAV